MDSTEIVILSGLDTAYKYRELEQIPEPNIRNYAHQTRTLFAPISRSFDEENNSEWFIRSYLSLKYVLAGTVLGTSADYAEDCNLQVTLPYLTYYMMLSCCRSFIFSLPCTEWRGQKSIEMNHSNIINTTINGLRRLDKGLSETYGKTLKAAQSQREIFSYRFPSSGLGIFSDERVYLEQAIKISRLLTDLTQFNLACLESSVLKHGTPPYRLGDHDDMWHLMQYDSVANQFIDDNDYHRVGYFLKKYTRPVELSCLATAGLVEDFFGAWCAEEPQDNAYDPDKEWDLLLWNP